MDELDMLNGCGTYGWLLGSQAFVDRIRRELKSPCFADEVPRVRTLEAIDVETVSAEVSDVETVSAEVSDYYKVEPVQHATRCRGIGVYTTRLTEEYPRRGLNIGAWGKTKRV